MSGKLALMFGYSYDLATIKAQAPKLNFDVAKLLKSKETRRRTLMSLTIGWNPFEKSAHIDEAWDFVQFIAKEEQAKGI
jgi:ABC-type glycerol-3-phosphate transport system substrate-binding protein